MSDRPTKVEKTEARQAKAGVGVRYVLIGGLALIILAGILIYAFVR